MNTGNPRDVDPSITGQPHQVTGEVPDLMGTYRGRLVTRWTCQRRYEHSYRRISVGFSSGPFYAAPRWSASHTAVDSRAPSSTARPQWEIQAATPSGVPETYPSSALT